MYVMELCRGRQVICYTEYATTAEVLAAIRTHTVNEFRYRLSPPDITGEIPGDEQRYARQCAALGSVNVFADPESEAFHAQ